MLVHFILRKLTSELGLNLCNVSLVSASLHHTAQTTDMYACRHGHAQVASLLESAGCAVEDVPELNAVERAAATLYIVKLRSVIREELLVTSADVGFLNPQELVHVIKLHVDAEGNKRGQVDRGWVTVSAGRSSDSRTAGVVRLEPAGENDSVSDYGYGEHGAY